jgi:hypothetical protein
MTDIITFRPTYEIEHALEVIEDYLRKNSPPGVRVNRTSAIWYAIETAALRIEMEEHNATQPA